MPVSMLRNGRLGMVVSFPDLRLQAWLPSVGRRMPTNLCAVVRPDPFAGMAQATFGSEPESPKSKRLGRKRILLGQILRVPVLWLCRWSIQSAIAQAERVGPSGGKLWRGFAPSFVVKH